MRLATPPENGWLPPFLERLDRIAKELNPLLTVIVIGLAILTFSVFIALQLSRLPLR
jgi:multisubunit Na+/H+ antiporter MnhC subunit